ncbi:MAG: hypothetical protein WD200_00215 [Candidatus Andersenbacteria bacterium]
MTDWLAKAFIAMLFLIPVFVATPILQKSFGIRPEATLVWWFFGVVVGVACWLYSDGGAKELAPSTPTWIVCLLGLTTGTVANICLFQSLATAPNPGLTLAIVNANSVAAYFAMVLLALLLPRYFVATTWSWQDLIGVLLVTAGIALISIKK